MKMPLRILLMFAVSLVIPTIAPAQDIQMSSEDNSEIGDGESFSGFDTTFFEYVIVGQSRTRTFRIHNTSNVTTLTINSFFVADGTHFDLTATADTFVVPPSSFRTFDITFQPQSAGSKSTIVTIFSSDPDSESDYVMNLVGNGVDSLPAYPDLGIRLTKPIKPKLNKETGKLRIKMKFEVTNAGAVSATTPTIVLFQSSSEVLQNLPLVFLEIPTKPLAAAANGKVKKKRVTIKIDNLSNTTAWMFADLSQPGVPDLDSIDFLTSGKISAIVP